MLDIYIYICKTIDVCNLSFYLNIYLYAIAFKCMFKLSPFFHELGVVYPMRPDGNSLLNLREW